MSIVQNKYPVDPVIVEQAAALGVAIVPPIVTIRKEDLRKDPIHPRKVILPIATRDIHIAEAIFIKDDNNKFTAYKIRSDFRRIAPKRPFSEKTMKKVEQQILDYLKESYRHVPEKVLDRLNYLTEFHKEQQNRYNELASTIKKVITKS